MREIKFRAWHKKKRKMYLVAKIDFAFLRVTCYEEDKALIGHKFEFKDIILMQYTGLKDKSGKEIYEGDIIKHDYYYDYGQSGEYKNFTKCVIWDDIYCGFKPMYATGEYSLPRNSIEVIGNIYENPELIT